MKKGSKKTKSPKTPEKEIPEKKIESPKTQEKESPEKTKKTTSSLKEIPSRLPVPIPKVSKPEIDPSQIPLPEPEPEPEEERTPEETKIRKQRADKGLPRGSYKKGKKARSGEWDAPFDLCVILLTRFLARLLRDEEWIANEEESEDFSLAINTLLNEKYPDKALSNGWILLATAGGSYLLPRIMREKKEIPPVQKETPEIAKEISEPDTMKDALAKEEVKPLTEDNIGDYKPTRKKE